MSKCCGTCKYHVAGEIPGEGDYICNNAESDAYGCETMYSDECEDYESRGNE